MSIMMERYLKRAGISTPMGRVLDEAKRSQASKDAEKAYHAIEKALKSLGVKYKSWSSDKSGGFDVLDGDQAKVLRSLEDLIYRLPHEQRMWANANDYDGKVQVSVSDPDAPGRY